MNLLSAVFWSHRYSQSTKVKNGNRLDPEIRRRTKVVGIFPDRNSMIRFVGAALAKQHNEWAQGQRYLGLDVPTRSQTIDLNEAAILTLQALTA